MSNPRDLDKMPLVVCECGFEILLVPDLDEMARSIEAHAVTHENKEIDMNRGKDERCRIEELLAQKTIILIGKNE